MNPGGLVITLLKSLPGGRCCDDCLSRKTGIRPRQEVSRLCRALVAEGRLVRKRGKCPLGNHTKVLNTLAAARAGRSKSPKPASPARKRRSGVPRDMGVEDAWRYVDRFCRAVWVRHLDAEPPSSLAEIITVLRDEELVPGHEANMMHTIRSLRNMVVHENVEFGEHETAIARAAWQIIRKWAEQREDELWSTCLSARLY